jgi:hypothetical protein
MSHTPTMDLAQILPWATTLTIILFLLCVVQIYVYITRTLPLQTIPVQHSPRGSSPRADV